MPSDSETAKARSGSVQPDCSAATSNNQNLDHESDHWDYEEPDYCPTCGGDGMIEYMEGGPEVWGEDCPSEMNHMVTCPNCRGSGMMKDCSTC